MIPPPTRIPKRLWRVQWSRPHWQRDAAGRPRWKGRWFGRLEDADRFATSLESEGVAVLLDHFNLQHTHRRPQAEERWW